MKEAGWGEKKRIYNSGRAYSKTSQLISDHKVTIVNSAVNELFDWDRSQGGFN